MNAILVLMLIACGSAQKYVEKGAIFTEPGTFELNNPSPSTILINDYKQCSEDPLICYEADAGTTEVWNECGTGFCSMNIELALQKSSLGPAVIDGDSMVFKQGGKSSCNPKVSNGAHVFKVITLPKNCDVMVAGATNPKAEETTKGSITTTETTTTTTESSEMSATMKIVIAGSVLSAVIILIFAGIVVFFCVLQPRMRARAVRRQAAMARPAQDEENANLILHQPPKAPKKTPKATPVKSKEAKTAGTTATTTTNAPKVENKKKKPSNEKTEPTIEAAPQTSESKALTTTNEMAPLSQANQSLKENRTQNSPTGSEGTPPVDRATAAAMKQSSLFTAKHYVPRRQAMVPYKKKGRADSLDQLVPVSDSLLASLQRLQRVSPTIQMVVAERWSLDVEHEITQLEKDLLRETNDVGLDALEQLIVHLDIVLPAHGAIYGDNDTSVIPWKYVNAFSTPASAAFRLFVKCYPAVFENVEPHMDDPMIANFSVPGLYALLFHDGFKRKFKLELLKELHERASVLIHEVPMNNLVGSAFPLNYLARRYEITRALIRGSRTGSRAGSRERK